MERSKAALRTSVIAAIAQVAPEADAASLAGDVDIRDELDIDSMDFLSFVTALHRELGVDIAESDYPRLCSVDGAVEFLAHALERGG